MIRRSTVSVLVAASLLFGGCGQKTKVVNLSEEEAADPTRNFQAGIESLVPDRNGNVNYTSAYDFFAKAETLGGGKKASFNAGWTAEHMGDIDKAATHYRKAYDADPNYEPAMFSLARVLTEKGQYDEVAGIYSSYLEAHPDNKDVRGEYMEALVQAGKYDQALEEGRAILRKDPNSDAVYRALSSLYLKQGKLDMARIMGDKALELNDADPDIYNNMGVVFLQNNDLPAAIDKFQTARKLDSTHYEANVNLGLIALDAGDYTLALECFNAALQRNPSSADARMGKAVALRGTGEFKEAGAIYDALIKEDPGGEMAYFNAATMHEKYTKDFTKSLKYLEAYKDAHVGQLGPNDPVFKRIQAVEDAKTAEEARLAAAEAARKAEEERKRRAKELLATLEARVKDLQGKVDARRACLPEEISGELDMFAESALELIGAEDTEMATEMDTMLNDYYGPMLDTASADACGDMGAAPAEGDAAPAEGDAAPAEGEAAPAEGEPAPAETDSGETAEPPAEGGE